MSYIAISIEVAWPQFCTTLRKILNEDAVTSYEWQDCFSLVYDMCLHGSTNDRNSICDLLKEELIRIYSECRERIEASQDSLA
ncbi:hypothetical protein Pmani_037036 [Petrolisthes manimaculis]|uniref:Uncharacterized protein n=1 Tax=Petrolisthes manimaculis TaxID=1843537 RepID=A0AAE1TNQ9_9EUCA|nr:hypothetical protein Pmani_037036 [Petrolisthes manimaculis]